MFKYCILELLVILCTIIHHSDAEGACSYAECIFEGQGENRYSDIEQYIVFMNITLMPGDITETICPRLKERATTCAPRKRKCRRQTEFKYDSRLKDGQYVMFLTDLGLDVCNNLTNYLDIQRCVTPDMLPFIQSCITRGVTNSYCLEFNYKEMGDCSQEQVIMFRRLVFYWLIQNPYNEFDTVKKRPDSDYLEQ